MKRRAVGAIAVLAAGVGCIATLALVPSPSVPVADPPAVTQTEAPKPAMIPWCKVLDGNTVVGQAGGKITVEGVPAGVLVLVDEDVADESGPYSGYLANVEMTGDDVVAVQGRACL